MIMVIHNDPSVKFPLIIWFLIMSFNLYFYQHLWVKGVYIHIENSSGNIRLTYSQPLEV